MSTITLPDGRDLGLELNGPDHGPVIVFHHGTPGCVVAPTGARTRRGGARTSLRHHSRGPGTPCHPDSPGAAWPTSPPTSPRHRSGAGNIEEFGAVLADVGVPTYLWQGSKGLRPRGCQSR